MTATAPPPAAGSRTGASTDGTLPAPAAAIFFLGALGGIQAVDPTIASTALVKASRGLSMEGGMIALAASLSTLVLAATVISAGLLGDRLGWRRLLTAGLLLAVVGDLSAALAPAAPVYLFGRAVAGLGLGAVFAASFAYIRIITPRDRMARALGLYSASGSVVLVVFSFVGGLLASFEWRAAFLLIPVACVVSVAVARVVLPLTGRRADGPADVPGQVLLALGIVGVLFGISHLSKGVGEPLFWGPVLAGVVLLGAFSLVESRGAHPFFPLAVLRHPLFLGALTAGFIYNFAQSSTILQFSNLWQYVAGLAPVRVSLGLLPFLLVGIAAALITGRLLTRGMSNGTAILAGGVIAAAGGAATLLHSDGRSYLTLVPALLLLGFGATMASIPYGGLVVKAASGKLASFYGPITSSRTTFGQVAYALGLALSTVMVDKLTTGGVVRRLTAAGVPPARTASALDGLGVYVRTGKDPSTALGEQALAVARQSYTNSFKITMVAVGAACLLAGVVGRVLLGRAAAAERAADADDTPVATPA
ncbi:MAG: MFS transporter [Microthrixaceae bacterium]